MSNIVKGKETKKSGLYDKGFRHDSGGILVIVDKKKPIEVEIGEYKLRKDAVYGNKVYSFKNKTNLEILDHIFVDNKLTFKIDEAESGDYIICRLATLDPNPRTFNGTALDFINLIQGQHGCKTTGNNDYTFEHRLGGEISPTDTDIDSLKEKIKKVEDINLWLQKYISENEKNILDLKVKDYKTQLSVNKKTIKSYNDRIKEISKNELKKSDDLEFKITEQELPYKGNPNAKWVKVTYTGKDGETLMQGVAIDLYGSKEKAIEAAKEKIKSILKKESDKQELKDLIDLFKEAVKENPKDQESKDLLELYEENLKEFDSKFEKGGSIELLAPNGKPSNLNKQQYELVRSPEFISWFGDWINEPKNSSKVIDDNGEPLVVFHGAVKSFNIFDRNKLGSFTYKNTTVPLTGGFFFSSEYENAMSYVKRDGQSLKQKVNRFISGHIKECFLNIRDIYTVKGSSKWDCVYSNSDTNECFSTDDISRSVYTLMDNDGVLFKNVIDTGNKEIWESKADIYVVFQSNQIKLADGSNNTFYSNNPDIRFEYGGELNAEETIVNAPCINEKFKFVESSDYNEYRKGGSVNSMSKKELEAFYNTKEGKELDRQTYNKWKKLVNMSKSELEKFYNSEEGKEAGLSASEAKEKGIDSGRESARWIMKMKDIPYSEWTSDMWIWAKKQISFISRMSGMKGDLYDDKGNKTRKHTALLIWGHNPEKYEDGGAVSFDKVISASTRFRPSETVVFDPPLEGKNGAKLISYTWSYEWTMTPNREGELKSKRVSDWTQAEISADTGRDIVHQYTVLMPDGEYKTVSSDSVPILLGYIDRKELKSFPNLVTASKTLAKQQMQLAILETKYKEYKDAVQSIKDKGFPEPKVEKFDGYTGYKLYVGDGSCVIDENGTYDEGRLNCAKGNYIKNRLIEMGIDFNLEHRSSTIYELKQRIERQKRKVENILNTKMENGGKIKSNKVSFYQTNFSGLSFSDLGGYFDSNFTEVIDLEDENVILKNAPIFLFFKNPYDTRYSSKISIDDVIGAVIPKKMEQDARTIFDKRYIPYITYNDDASNEDKIEAIKKLAEINEDIILP